MPKWLLQVAVYPLILINLALGFFMFIVSHQAILIATNVLHKSGFTKDLGPFRYIQNSVSSIGAILLGLLAIILFPILERYYYKASSQSQTLFIRFFRIVAIQLVYLGAVQILVLGLTRAYGGVLTFIAVFELTVGILLFYQLKTQTARS